MWIIFLLSALKSRQPSARVRQSAVSRAEILSAGCENKPPSSVPCDLLTSNQESHYSGNTGQPAAAYCPLLSLPDKLNPTRAADIC